VKPHPCPICKKSVTEQAAAWPFCCERCRLIDLGNWLGGRYAIPGDEVNDEELQHQLAKQPAATPDDE
jgi:endogenous inhibitor of DNA gyrase (YacG/DUF329 family)